MGVVFIAVVVIVVVFVVVISVFVVSVVFVVIAAIIIVVVTITITITIYWCLLSVHGKQFTVKYCVVKDYITKPKEQWHVMVRENNGIFPPAYSHKVNLYVTLFLVLFFISAYLHLMLDFHVLFSLVLDTCIITNSLLYFMVSKQLSTLLTF